MTERELFIAALRLPEGDARDAFLEAACADKPLRERVESMLRDHEQLGSFLESPAAPPTATADYHPGSDGPGAVIGHYKLLEAISEGGMGAVFMAEQTQPVKRLVALKLIKAGMDSRQVLARFEAERQALALMDHPNIAKVLDAGATEHGRPYFVMELVKGVPITRFCDERRLTPRERLELAIPVCQAVQHAHQKGVIHRDLKPSNVLVGLYDGVPVPKVIDFGVAKATGQKLTEATLFTGFGAVVGTPEYMSPEQAQLDNLDIDTRSDVYALGVLLYELLTGTTPLNRKRLKEVAVLEVLRAIREQEPPRPSLRLYTTEELPSIAACRNIEPRRLSSLVRGELDWIVMTALEKDRNRRYETASSLAMDLRRYLDDEPVQACPPSAGYRLRKFARRNRAALAMTWVVMIALIALGVAAALAHRNQIAEQRRLIERQVHAERLLAERRQNTLESAMMEAMGGDFDAAGKRIDEAELLGASTGQLRLLRGQVAFHRGDMEGAIQELEQAARLVPVGQPGAVAARAMLAVAYINAFQFRYSRFLELWRELEQQSPISPEDFLFKGLLEATSNPERGLRTLDDGIRRHDSILARATRLEARANRAMLTGNIDDAELALDDAQVARSMLPRNTLILARSVFADLVAAGAYEANGRPKDRERVLAHARGLVEDLESFVASPLAAKACFEYFEYVGDEEAAYAMSERGNPLRRAVMLYRRGEFTKAREVALERSRSGKSGPTEQIERGLILAELPDGPARARAEFEDIRAASSTWPLEPPVLLLFLGKPQEARHAWLNVPKEDIPVRFDEWWLQLWDYTCGRITGDQLLQTAGRDRGKLSIVHFVIGLWRLSEGDRPAAQEQFRECVATRAFANWEWPWVRAFLKRMDADPLWPRWIPQKTQSERRNL